MTETELSLIRTEMQTALSMFLEHVKYTITLMSTVSAAGAALIAFCLQQQAEPTTENVILLIAVISFTLVFFLSILSTKIVERYYKIYASNYIYSARAHLLTERKLAHPWIDNLTMTGVQNVFSPDALSDFMDTTTGEENHSWRYYKWIIRAFRAIGIAGIVLAIVVAIFL